MISTQFFFSFQVAQTNSFPKILFHPASPLASQTAMASGASRVAYARSPADRLLLCRPAAAAVISCRIRQHKGAAARAAAPPRALPARLQTDRPSGASRIYWWRLSKLIWAPVFDVTINAAAAEAPRTRSDFG